jgi:transcriptional regulator with XRE-family HTH domain
MTSRLEAYRLERGWSKSELARRSGINQTTIMQITNGQRRPNASQLERLSIELRWDGPPADLLDEVDDAAGA